MTSGRATEPDTRVIATAFVRGVNAWVAVAREHPPEEFALAGWLPEAWRAEDLLNRTDAFLASGDAAADVFRARLATAVGPARAAALLGDAAPVAAPPGIDLATVTFQIGDALRQVGTRSVLYGASTAGRQQRMGDRRRALCLGRSAAGCRSASAARQSGAALSGAPHRAWLERGWRHCPLAPRRGYRAQRSRRVGHDRVRGRHRRHLCRTRQPRELSSGSRSTAAGRTRPSCRVRSG